MITIRKYSNAGSQQWAFRQPNENFSFPSIQSLDVDGSGNIIAGGDGDHDGTTQRCLFYLDSSGTLQWSKSQSDGFFLVRAVAFDSEGTGDAFVAYRNTSGVERLARLNADGTTDWDGTVAGTGITINRIDSGAGGDIFVAGDTSGGTGHFGERRISGVDGSLVWEGFDGGLGTFGNGNGNYESVHVTANEVFFGGAFTSGDGCLWRADHDGNGLDQWGPMSGLTEGGGTTYGIVVDSTGAIIVAGQFQYPSDTNRYQMVKLTRSGSAYSESWKKSLAVNSGGAHRVFNDIDVDSSDDLFGGSEDVSELNTHGKYSGTDGSPVWEADHGQDNRSVRVGSDDTAHFGFIGA